MHDLAVIVVSTGQGRWLQRCLATLLEHAGGLALDVVVVDNGPAGDTEPLVEREFPGVRVLDCENRGFGHANNLGLAATASRHVLFLNPDTEVLTGTLAALVAELDRRPEVGLVGVRQVGEDGIVQPTMRRFPSVSRTLGDALGLERLPGRPDWLGERELRLGRYDEEFEGDWTSGSFMLVRGEALAETGPFDERFFVYSEEIDLCLLVRRASWKAVRLPTLTIFHAPTLHAWSTT